MMRLRFLGTGTSTGVPQIGCTCPTCISTDTHDKRLRSSAILSVNGKNILIDCGPDFRQQIIDAGAPDLCAALLTHSHYDHVGGIDDLRPYCYRENGFPLYCKKDVAYDLRTRVPYCFKKHPYPGVPIFNIHEIEDNTPFDIDGIRIVPLPVIHLKLPIVGFRINNFAYITDAKVIPESTLGLIEGVDTLVLNSLRKEKHLSHMSLSESLDIVKNVSPRITYLTHLADKMGKHAEIEKELPENVRVAYDGLEIVIPD